LRAVTARTHTARQREVLDFVRAHATPPTLRDIGERFGISRAGAQNHVGALVRKNALRRDARGALVAVASLPIVADAPRPTACAGSCCKAVTLFALMPEGRVSISPEMLREYWLAWRSGQSRFTLRDIDILYPMLRHLGELDRNPMLPASEPSDRKAHYYACKHLTADNLCSIYEDRPAMCRTFPEVHAPCEFPGCGQEVVGDAGAEGFPNAPLCPAPGEEAIPCAR
jgi:Fe-S-cluster containining protein/DNA-binding CsgD family transcriptional regulator